MATAASVSRQLGTQFDRSKETKSSTVRGWSNYSRGYSVQAGFCKTDPITVEYTQGDGARHMPAEERVRREEKALAEYTEFLESKGYTVTRAKRGTSRQVLEVTK